MIDRLFLLLFLKCDEFKLFSNERFGIGGGWFEKEEGNASNARIVNSPWPEYTMGSRKQGSLLELKTECKLPFWRKLPKIPVVRS